MEWQLTAEEQRAIANELPVSSAFGAQCRQDILDAQLLAQAKKLVKWLEVHTYLRMARRAGERGEFQRVIPNSIWDELQKAVER